MRTLHTVALTTCLFGLSATASAEIVNLTNSADGANRDAGIQAVKDKLHVACTDRKGTPKPDSFEVVFERTSENPDVPKPYYVDAKMQCDLPAG